jgi:hypothetical protein
VSKLVRSLLSIIFTLLTLITLFPISHVHGQSESDAAVVIAGRVLDERGSGLEGVPVFLVQNDRVVVTGQTKPDGSFELEAPLSGEYQVQVRGAPTWRAVGESVYHVTAGAGGADATVFRFETKTLVEATVRLLSPLHEAVVTPPATLRWAPPAGETPRAYEVAYGFADNTRAYEVVESLEVVLGEEGLIWWQVRPLYTGDRVGRWSAPWQMRLSTTEPAQEGYIPPGQLEDDATLIDAQVSGLIDEGTQPTTTWHPWVFAVIPVILMIGGLWAFKRPPTQFVKGESP